MTRPVLLQATGTRETQPVDVRLRPGGPIELERHLTPEPADRVVDAAGTTLLPGLHDHHVHLLATAAARGSVRCGPDDVVGRDGLAASLRGAATDADGWVRAIGYHDDVAGPLDRDTLDALVPDRPVRVQDSSGALWILNSPALAALERGAPDDPPPGLERRDGRPTGRLWRGDAWLRRRLPHRPPDLSGVVADLVRQGVTGVTDATPDLPPETRDLLVDRVASGPRGQRLHLLGADPPVRPTEPWRAGRATAGPAKVVLADHRLPTLPDLVALLERQRARPWSGSGPRPVAVHCVTRVAAVLLLAALELVGTVPGDRIEHGSVLPVELDAQLRDGGLAVVTQPAFVTERGDRYLREVAPDDLPHLYRHASLRQAGITVVASSDSPYTRSGPWRTIEAAATRTTSSGRTLGPGEVSAPADTLEGYLRWPDRLDAAPRRVVDGAPADVCLVAGTSAGPWGATVDGVLLTAIDGRVVHDRVT